MYIYSREKVYTGVGSGDWPWRKDRVVAICKNMGWVCAWQWTDDGTAGKRQEQS